MIPKNIHYCWFGRNPLPKLAQKCIKSWKKHCPDYEIIQWNEDNFDISAAPLYVRQAYEAKKWAFVTDYVRLKVVYEHGGIYLDTDVELKKNLDVFLSNSAFFGFEDGMYINTGLGFGAEKSAPILAELMEDYWNVPFLLPNGSFDITSCPTRNTKIFLSHGLKQDDSKQMLDDGTLILPSIYMCPLSYGTGKRRRSSKTISIHWFSASWQSEKERSNHQKYLRQQKREAVRDGIIHFPNRCMKKLLGDASYGRLKQLLKRGK